MIIIPNLVLLFWNLNFLYKKNATITTEASLGGGEGQKSETEAIIRYSHKQGIVWDVSTTSF